MRASLSRTLLAALACALYLTGCNDSLALKDTIEDKVAYATATYEMSLASNDPSGGSVNFDTRMSHNGESVAIVATPSSGWLFSHWVVEPGNPVVVADPFSESTTASLVESDAEIEAFFIPPANRKWSAIASSSSGQYLVAGLNLYMDDANAPGIYTSSNYGATWKVQRNSPRGMTCSSIASDASGRYLVAAADILGKIYTSDDYGATWTARYAGLTADNDPSDGIDSRGAGEWSSVASDSSGRYLVAANRGGLIYRSTDFGATWSGLEVYQLNGGISTNVSVNDWCTVSSSANGARLTASTFSAEAFYSQDGGASWIEMTAMPYYRDGDSVYLSQDSLGTRFVVAVSRYASYSCAHTNNLADLAKPWFWYSINTLNTNRWKAAGCNSTGEFFIGALDDGTLIISDDYFNGSFTAHSGGAILPAGADWRSVCSNAAGTRFAAAANGGHIYLYTVGPGGAYSWSLGL